MVELPPATPLLGMGLPELERWAVAHGQAAFRGRQLHDWLYAKGARSLEAISVLPKAFREQLAAAPPRSWLRLDRPFAGAASQRGPRWHHQAVARHPRRPQP